MRDSIESIGVVGLGKLGACIAGVFASKGLRVVGYDTNLRSVMKVRRGQAPIFGEPEVEDLYTAHAVEATANVAHLVENTDACCFIVPTPSMVDGRFDNSYLIDAISKVAYEADRQNKQGYIFIINSTVTPGSCDSVFIPLIRDAMHGKPVGLAYKPEFIALGTVVRDLQEPDVILIGASCPPVLRLVKHLYSRVVVRGQFHSMDLKSAELAKISLNCFVTMKISFANQIGMIADEIGADSRAVLEAVGADARVGNKNLIPGLPFGGPCFPRDNRMLGAISRTAALSVATDSINFKIKNKIFAAATGAHVDGPIGILGTAYKPGTRVTEESLGVWLYDQLTREGYKVKTYDPAAPCSHSLDDVLSCSTIIIACAHKEFGSILFGRDQKIIDPAKIANPARVQHLDKAVVTAYHGANANIRS